MPEEPLAEPHPPPRRQVARWEDAEVLAGEWMRYWGFADARVTDPGPDDGLDVVASGAVAQVKWRAAAVGAPDLQRLVGARGREVHKRALFFTGANYSARARAYADEMDIALFVYQLDGAVAPVNAAGRAVIDDADRARAKERGRRAASPAHRVATTLSGPGAGPTRTGATSLAAVAQGWPAPVWAGCGALVLFIPSTLLVVGAAALLAGSEHRDMSWLVTLLGATAVVFSLVAVRRAARPARSAGRPRVAALVAAAMAAPAAALWVTLVWGFTHDPVHPAGGGLWVLVAGLLMLLVLVGAVRAGANRDAG